MSQLPLFSQLPATYQVSEINRYIRDLMEGDNVLQDLWVKGEVSNLSKPKSGHLYFTIKDDESSLRCVMWRNQAARLVYQFQNGEEVEVHGSISVYEASGQYQLYADQIQPVGEGLLHLEFQRLKNKLEKEGLFEAGRKRTIPERPNLIGIVTSPTGAALRDMINTITRRYPLVNVVLAPASVQGESAANEIVQSIQKLNEFVNPDVILVGRGGGSIEDLWSFNTEEVSRAIANSKVPVITGVGHETDFTISDFVADLRAPTPTAAAELAVPDLSELVGELENVKEQLGNFIEEKIQDALWVLKDIQSQLDKYSPIHQLKSEMQRVDDMDYRLSKSLSHELAIRQEHVYGVNQKLRALNPVSIMNRGYSVITNGTGEVISQLNDVVVGEQLKAQISDGSLDIEVLKKDEI